MWEHKSTATHTVTYHALPGGESVALFEARSDAACEVPGQSYQLIGFFGGRTYNFIRAGDATIYRTRESHFPGDQAFAEAAGALPERAIPAIQRLGWQYPALERPLEDLLGPILEARQGGLEAAA